MKNLRRLRIIFAVCCVVYIGWMIKISAFEFDRIHGQYRRVVEQLEDDRVRTAALAELASDCRRESVVRDEGACSSWPEPVVEARQQEIIEQVSQAKKRALVKLAMFYTIFVVFFLVAPPLLIYLIIVGIIKIYQDIKIVK